MMLIEKIREATKTAHEELDAAMMPSIKNIHSVNDYIKLLISFYGFFQPVYQQINTHLQTSFLPDYESRRKPDDILKNLTELHHQYPIENVCRQLPGINNNATAFGALYVMEGSTLGGLVIKKMIAAQTGLPDETISFFGGYGRQTHERWNTFIEAINKVAVTKTEEQSLMKTAVDTFICFKQWLSIVYF